MSSQNTRVSVIGAIIAAAYREERIREADRSRQNGFPTRPNSHVLSNMVDRVMAPSAGTTWRGTPNPPIPGVRSMSRDVSLASLSSNPPPLNAWDASNWDFIGENGTQIIANEDGTDKARRSGIVSPAVTETCSENVSTDVDQMSTMTDDGYTSDDDFSMMADDGSNYSEDGSEYSDNASTIAYSGSESEIEEQYPGFAPAPMAWAGAAATGH